jgi:hypothetical protein
MKHAVLYFPCASEQLDIFLDFDLILAFGLDVVLMPIHRNPYMQSSTR